MFSAMRRMNASQSRLICGSKERAVPISSASEGMTLNAPPAFMTPAESTALLSGSSSRLTKVCSAQISCAAATVGSCVWWGEAPCPPCPCSFTVHESEQAIIGPARQPSTPGGSGLHRCTPKIASTPSSARPSSTTARAPCTNSADSSEGWKISRTEPCSCVFTSQSIRTAPSSMAMWPSCPQACMTPRCREENGSPVSSAIGSASMSARRATRRPGSPPAMSAMTPVGRPRVPTATFSQPISVSAAAM